MSATIDAMAVDSLSAVARDRLQHCHTHLNRNHTLATHASAHNRSTNRSRACAITTSAAATTIAEQGQPATAAAAAAAAAAVSPQVPRFDAVVFAGRFGVAGTAGDGGQAADALINNPFGVVRGPDRAIYFCEYDGECVRRVGMDGIISTIAGCGRTGGAGDGGSALDAEFNKPHEIRFDEAGDLFVVERDGHRVRKIDMKTRIVSTVVGTGEKGFAGDGGSATAARLNQPHSIQFGPDSGDLYICDIGNHRIRRVDAQTGVISTFAGSGGTAPTPDGANFAVADLCGPRAMEFDGRGDLWLALREGNQIWRLDCTNGTAHHVAGTGEQGPAGDGGPAKEAKLTGPKGIALGQNEVFIVDTEAHSIRRIDTKTGLIHWVAGVPAAELTQLDGGSSGAIRFAPGEMARPHGVWVDSAGRYNLCGEGGDVYIGDSENHVVVRLKRAGLNLLQR